MIKYPINYSFIPNSSIVISEYSGRLGNNLMQLTNSIFICKSTMGCLTYPNHQYFNKQTFDFRQQDSGVVYISRFYDRIDCKNVFPTIYERRQIMLDYIRNLINLPLENRPEPDDHELVIQMRSGDIFNTPPPPKYVPSPLSFFKRVIESRPFKKVTIVCENLKNPCIEELVKIYDHCQIQSSDLQSDMLKIINARHLCITVGTFGYICALLSQTLRHLHVDDIPKGILDFGFFSQASRSLDFQIHRYRIHNYIQYNQWTNSSAQCKLIFNHSPSDIEYIAAHP